MTDHEPVTVSEDENESQLDVVKEKLHYRRFRTALNELVSVGAKTIVDQGWEDGKLLRMLLKEKLFEKILGVDVSYSTLEKAVDCLRSNEMSPKQAEEILVEIRQVLHLG